MVHDRATPNSHVVSERRCSDSANRNQQSIATQERDADIGGTRSNQGKNLTSLEAFDQRLVELQ